MKVLLMDDVYNLGRAGDVKKVADGYGRNYLLPQGLAVLATPGALKQVEHIRASAATNRAVRNEELSGVAEQLSDVTLTFPAKAGETGKLYGSVTTQMIADAIQETVGVEVDRRQLDTQPIRNLGEHKVNVRLTMDLIPEVRVVVYQEGESPESALALEDELDAEAVDEAEIVEEAEVLDEVDAIEDAEVEETEVEEELQAEVEEVEAEVEEAADEEVEEEAATVEDEVVAEEAEPEAEEESESEAAIEE